MKLTGNWKRTLNSIRISTDLGAALAGTVDRYARDNHNNNYSEALRHLWQLALDSDIPIEPYYLMGKDWEGINRYTVMLQKIMYYNISSIQWFENNKSAIYRSLTNIGLTILEY